MNPPLPQFFARFPNEESPVLVFPVGKYVKAESMVELTIEYPPLPKQFHRNHSKYSRMNVHT